MENKLKLKNLKYAEEMVEICKVSAELKNRPLEVSLEDKAYIQKDMEILEESFEYLLDIAVATKL